MDRIKENDPTLTASCYNYSAKGAIISALSSSAGHQESEVTGAKYPDPKGEDEIYKYE